MPREARKKSEIGIYHIMLRGINRQTIFEDDEDCEKYLYCLSDCKKISGFVLYAYCLMGNHVHLLLREVKEPLEQIFKRIGARYVFWYNWKYKRSGHLFQDRFKSEPINDDRQFIAVLRYIYQNPIKAQLCDKPEDYPWSSYNGLIRGTTITDNDKISEIVDIYQLRTLLWETSEEQFLDLEPDSRLTDREAVDLLKETCGIEHANDLQKILPDKQMEFLKILHKKGCSIRQLVRVSGISRARVERMIG